MDLLFKLTEFFQLKKFFPTLEIANMISLDAYHIQLPMASIENVHELT